MKSTNMLRQDLFVCNCILIQVNINTGRRAWKFALMQTYLLFVASVCVCYMLGCKQKVSVCEKKHLQQNHIWTSCRRDWMMLTSWGRWV